MIYMCLGCKNWHIQLCTLQMSHTDRPHAQGLVSLVLAKPVSPSPKIVPFAGFPSHLLPAESPQGSIGPTFPVDLQLLGSMIHGSFGVPVTSGWGGKSHSFQQVLQFWGHEFEILRASRVCLVLNMLTPYAFTGQQKQFRTTHIFKRG